jgi:hypothetical protein
VVRDPKNSGAWFELFRSQRNHRIDSGGAENLVLNQQLIVLRRARRRAPNLALSDG